MNISPLRGIDKSDAFMPGILGELNSPEELKKLEFTSILESLPPEEGVAKVQPVFC